MSTHLCDCGAVFSDLVGLEACQRGNHGQERPCATCTTLKTSHAALVEACRDSLANLEAEYRDRNGDANHDLMEQLRAALALAERGTP